MYLTKWTTQTHWSRIIDIPWDKAEMNINLEAFEEIYKQQKPNLIILGAMVTLFPYPVKEIREIIDDSTVLAYDGAHIGGLVAGKQFQDPLDEGADLLMVNTHKQMGEPPGALILSNEEAIARKISETTFPFLVATPYCNKFASLAVTLVELLKHADNYAEQIVSNAKTLGEALYNEGVNVLCHDKGYTESHMLMMGIREHGSGEDVERELAEAHIISNKMPLPGDSWDQKSGIRIGVNEVTRRGMKEPEMQQIASIIGDILVEDKPPADVAGDVISLMSGFQEVKYTL